MIKSVATAQSESEFQKAFAEYARLMGWQLAHFHNSQRPVRRAGEVVWIGDRDAKGFPDWVLCRERVLFVELKAQKGRVRKEQVTWMEALRDADAEVYLWRPSSWYEIEVVLK